MLMIDYFTIVIPIHSSSPNLLLDKKAKQRSKNSYYTVVESSLNILRHKELEIVLRQIEYWPYTYKILFELV